MNAEPGRGGLQEQRACRCAGLTHPVEAVARRGRAACRLQPQNLAHSAKSAAHRFGHQTIVEEIERSALLKHRRVEIGVGRRSVLHLDLVERDIQFFRDKSGQRGRDALSHLGTRSDDGDAVVGGDLDIGVECRLALGEVALQRIRVGFLDVPIADGHTAGDGCGADQECAAGNLSHAGHDYALAVFGCRAFGLRRGCADTCRTGTDCRPSLRRSRRRSGSRSRPAARRRS